MRLSARRNVDLPQPDGPISDTNSPGRISRSTSWSDPFRFTVSESPNKNCAYAWLDHIISPETNATVTEWYGEAPANSLACDLTSPGHCESFHAGDEAYAEQIWYWTTPIEQCIDGRTDVQCTDYGRWTQAWTEVKG